jgi:hypothetical protein
MRASSASKRGIASASLRETRASDAWAADSSSMNRIGLPSAANVANGGSSGTGS